MNRLGFRLGGAAIGVLIGFALTALADLSLDLASELLSVGLRRGIENLLPTQFADTYGYALVVGFFSAFGSILIADNAH